MQGAEFEKAKRVLREHRQQIWQKYTGVVGTGLADVNQPGGLPAAGARSFGIIVFVEEENDRPANEQSIEDVPLTFQVSGHFQVSPGRKC